jgi:hypothetical protein
MADEKKVILGIQTIPLNSINDTIAKLNELSTHPWSWYMVRHNCQTFCHDVLKGGGFDVDNKKEYQNMPLTLPTVYLDSTHERFLIINPGEQRKYIPFEPRLLMEVDIGDLEVTENFAPEDIVKFLKFVLEFKDDVVIWQAELIRKETAQVEIEGIEFENMNTDKSPEEVARDRIKLKLREIDRKIHGDLKILFPEGSITPDLARKLKAAIAEPVKSQQTEKVLGQRGTYRGVTVTTTTVQTTAPKSDQKYTP